MIAQPRSDTAALVPVKAFATAKARLAPVLAATERAGLAEAMLRDVIAAAQGCRSTRGVHLLGGVDARTLAAAVGVNWLDDGGAADLNLALDKAANALAQQQVSTLLVLPGDLPTLQSEDIAALLACHHSGVTISPARSDGGTNALVISPPDAMGFRFGADSARRHLEGALAAGLPAQKMPLAAFARDIDSPTDLRWLCRQVSGEHTTRWLAANDIEQRLGDAGPTALQA